MALGPRLDLRQSQSLVMTPQLQQAIRLLALSNLEIESFVAEEVEKNPLLESGGNEAEEREEAESPSAESEEPATVDELVRNGDAAADAPLDVNYDSEDFHQDSASDSLRGADGSLGLDRLGGRGEAPDFDSFSGEGPSLHEHLIAQAREQLGETDFLIATQIIEDIFETGYFTGSLIEISQRLGVALAEVERLLAVVQTFDPPGVGARSLSECLALQAKEADRYDPAMARLIANLEYLGKGNMAALKRICGVDDEDLADMIRELRAYDPKPGCRYQGSGESAGVVPDIFVTRRHSGWAIELNGATLPRIIFNRSYYAELSSGPQDKRSKVWLSECAQSASWLLKALDQRARTIVKVATEIVKQQDGFFREGVAHLRPLTLRAVAEEIGMHESTVSRVTSNKYLFCARGLFELKYFFTSGIQSADGGEAVSAEAVKSHIKAMIAAEDPKKILSDDQLVEMLQAKGFDIARRTVAKYREAIGIGSSVQRRRQKAISGRVA
jgi:RNA polymerase sigma-54 factor